MKKSAQFLWGFLIFLIVFFSVCCYAKKTYETNAVIGQYQGTFPCGDCSGVKTILTLYQDQTYTLESDFQDNGNISISKGKWRVCWLSPVIELSHSEEEFLILNTETLELLGKDGEPIHSRFNYKVVKTSQKNENISE